MRVSYLLTVSLLAVIFSMLSGGDCTPPKPVRHRHEARQDSLHSSGGEEPVSKLNHPPSARGIQQGIGRMLGSPGDLMNLDNAPLQSMDKPEVLRMDRATFNRLDVKRKLKLTEGLSAKEWNELLQNFWVEGEDNTHILYYTLKYDEERRLKMLKAALTKNLQHLFTTMCDLAYVPNTFKVIELLERGLRVYPHLRYLILPTIYQLDFPITKWHLDTTEDDVELLKHLIKMRWIKRDVVTGHLAEIVTLYPLEILNSLLAERILTISDVCTIELYCEVCGRGGREYLEWAKDNCELELDQGCIDAAVSRGHEDVVEYIAEELDMEMLPSQNAVNEAAKNGMLKLLRKKCPVWGLFPNTGGANGAASNGHVQVLKWLAVLEPEEHRVYPNQYGADWAAAGGHLRVLEWLATLEPEERRVYPNQDGANYSAMNGHLDVLKWLAEERQVYPDQYGVNEAAGSGQLDVLKWLATLEPRERRGHPNLDGAKLAAGNGHLEVLKWLATLEPEERRVYPHQYGANLAAGNGQLVVLKWLAEERRVYPGLNDANVAAGNGQLDVLKWLAEERQVYPDQDGANWAAENGQLDVLKWLARLESEEHRVYPDQNGANDAAAHGRLEVVEWLATLEAKERRVYPNRNGADRAAMNGHLDVLKWLAKLEPKERRVYPSPYSTDTAAMNGHLKVLEWSRERGSITN